MSGKSLFLFGFLVVYLESVHAQGFELTSLNQGIQVYNPGAVFGGGVSFYDFNKDGLDDLTFCVMGDSIIFFENNGTAFVRYEIIPNTADAKQPVWVDIDNDLDADLMVTKRNGGLALYEKTATGTFSDITSQLDMPNAPGALSYGCAWADYDKDGLLDCYVCNYNWNDGVQNWLFHNLGGGTFEEIAINAGVDNGSRPSFQSVWIDYNFDGWPDLFVVNDKLTGNALYRNLGNGTFQDVSVTTGAYQAMCAMSAGVTDFERDGDWDIYISNFIFDNSFLKFENGTYSNIVEESGLEVNAMCWGSLWIDYDNDSDEDLHVATTSPTINSNQNYFYRNNGDGSFDLALEAGFVNDDFNSYSSAKGDWNRDGFPDMIVTNTLNNTASLYTNVGVGGNSITVGLAGTVSNADAVGSLIQVFAGDLHLMQYTMCGENYMAQDSQYELFGIGDMLLVDSILITWPSGFLEAHYTINANQLYMFTEGETLEAMIIPSPSAVLCGSDTISLHAGQWSTYLWSTGETSSEIQISQPGEYGVVVFNEYGLSDTTVITVMAMPQPQWNVSIVHPACFGDATGQIEVELMDAEPAMIIWSNGSSEIHLEEISAGTYSFNLETTDGCAVSDTVFVVQPELFAAEVSVSPATCSGYNDGSIVVSTSGGTGQANVDWVGLNPDELYAGVYYFNVSDDNGCEISLEAEVAEPLPIMVTDSMSEPACPGQTGAIEIETSGGTGILEMDWLGTDPLAVLPGNYQVLITDEMGCELYFGYSITEYPPIIGDLDVVHPDNANNGSIAINLTGGTPPYELAWSNGEESTMIENLGAGIYACLVTDAEGCNALFNVTLIDVSINEAYFILDGMATTFDQSIELPLGFNENIIIYDISGRIIFMDDSSYVRSIDSSSWSDGMYFLNGRKKLFKISR